MRVTTRTIRELKGQRMIVALTAYDVITARLADRAGVDVILVGDSVGTTLLGFASTVPVTLDMMVHHAAAVSRADPDALLVVDLPFGLARSSFDNVLGACIRLMQEGGAEAVKIEGGVNIVPTVERLVQAGVPVMGHVGLMPQKVMDFGRYRKFGIDPVEREKILEDAKALEAAGVFAIIAEMIDADLGGDITDALSVPLIGIGAGGKCDGQILVSTDLLGLHPGKPASFVKTYANLSEEITNAFRAFAEDIREGRFPE